MRAGATVLAFGYKTGKPQELAKTTKTGRSEAAAQFSEKRQEYSSMDNKPLQPYNQHAYRSRNAQADVKTSANNSSAVSFDQGLHVCKKRQFHTTHKNCYKGRPVDARTNAGILSDEYKKNCFFLNL